MINRTTEELLKVAEEVIVAKQPYAFPSTYTQSLIAELSAKLHLLDFENSELKFDLEAERNTNIADEAENKELSAKLREREQVLDHIHHVAAGACDSDSDKDKTLLRIICEASATPPK